ncbi:MAG TPA: siphovirus Gp157 family protein [Bryobacteraceae bacterium]|nr:siphovirus Gp157 family protein [Bryobacteraceae bacterium]
MSAIPMAIAAQDVAKGLSMFEIDESLESLVEEAEQEAEANNGEISEDLKNALATYAEAFGYKVDRIANYLKAQNAEAELAQREAERLQARHKAAENREKRLKQMLVWFMISRSTPKLRGSLNTISLQANSVPSLTIQETTHIPDSFYRARVELTWPEWREIVDALPPCPLRDRLGAADGKTVQKDLQRGILSDALARGETITGVSLVKGHHVRLR